MLLTGKETLSNNNDYLKNMDSIEVFLQDENINSKEKLD